MITLRDLYIVELQDLLDAEQHVLLEFPSIADSATSSGLRDALNQHIQETSVHIERLQLLLRKLDAESDVEPCDAIHGLIKEGRRRIDAGERGAVLDAALIAIAQRIEHYEMAAYGCARTFAHTLGDNEGEALLQQTLDEEGAADARLTKIAEQEINRSAGEDAYAIDDEQRARLRYVPTSALEDFKYGDYRVRSADHEDLGGLDGLIIDTRTDRPQYFVIDSGGWFIGQKFLVPINALKPDDATRTLRTQLDRRMIEVYPPFKQDAFVAPGRRMAGQNADEYRPPTWLMTGVWMTEASGFASVPPRAESDFGGK